MLITIQLWVPLELPQKAHFETEFIYSYGANFDTYKFALPNPWPGPVPNKDDGVHWDVKEGIGSGPILLKKTNFIQGNPERFDYTSMINFRHPRSAICIDMLNNLYFVAIDGRYSESDGLTMP